MAQFRFRLSTVLRLREQVRDERRGRLAEAYAAEQKLLARRDELQQEILNLKRNYRGPAGAGMVNIDQLLAADRYEVILKSEQQVIEQQRGLLNEEIEKRRQALVAADRDVRVVELLREKLRQKHEQAEASRAMKQLDELASRQRWVGET
jgi:flagellar FliJ protein